ncbi:amidohydrolase/deacetylase family metallohydrolase [Vibrio aphrogenes]|uniref:amidohydrolase/deacetylase family metallohydrolase n=1 Tax=Vibrio aphrogenes TaxID=1891186 RepID=UPI000B354155|nr:amidohydrolase/deacetylase family metallohydrolase [Vibrio aphrogenes]
MYDLLIKSGKLMNGQLVDVAVRNGNIVEIRNSVEIASIKDDAKQYLDLQGRYYISAGWIDLHTHCYAKSPIYHDEPDLVGVNQGVTTVIDAGSVGADDVDDFYQLSCLQKTNVFSLLNISRIGLLRQNELANLSDIDKELAASAIQRHPEFIKGLKARMSGSVVEQSGLEPLRLAKEIQRENHDLPLMVHIGNNPPNLDDVVNLLDNHDVITHCYNGKPNRILEANGELKPAVAAALKRGLKFDIGHGGASFSFDVAEQAIAQGIYPDTISSDIYCKNRELGPVRSLAHIMSKFLAIGLTAERIVQCVTKNAAEVLRLEQKGQLAVGKDADLTIFDIVEHEQSLVDTEAQTRQGTRAFQPLAAIVSGHVIPTIDGVKLDVFNS